MKKQKSEGIRNEWMNHSKIRILIWPWSLSSKKKVPTCIISSFIEVKMDTNQLQIHIYKVCAPIDWITTAIHRGSNLKSLSRQCGVMEFQTFLAILLIPGFVRFSFKELQRDSTNHKKIGDINKALQICKLSTQTASF